MTARWSVAQACMWIGTRDEAQANGLNRRCTIFEAGFTIFEGDLTPSQSQALEAGAPDANIDDGTLDGMAQRKLVWDARHDLLDALRSNKLIAIGRANGMGDTVQINPELWPGLTLCDEPGDRPGRGVVARPEDGLNLSATWFDEVSRAVDDVRRIWPANPPAEHSVTLTAEEGEQPTKVEPKTASSPTYSSRGRYSPDKIPDQFREWALAQHNAGVTITAALVLEAMRESLVPGVGLSRETVRKWVKSLPTDWVAKRGTPLSR
jgi:hypothetical protein